MAQFFSYTVEHDRGFAPNPENGICTLVHCRFGGKGQRRDLVEMAEVGDWILGVGGASKRSSGKRTVLYVMRVDEKLPFDEFLRAKRFVGRLDCIDRKAGNLWALVSRSFFYFGRNAIPESQLPRELAATDVLRGVRRYRRTFDKGVPESFVEWIQSSYSVGVHGEPCMTDPDEIERFCKSRGVPPPPRRKSIC